MKVNLIRITEQDLHNIIKETVNNILLTESGQDKRVQKFLKDNGYVDYNQRMNLIGKIKHDIPNLRLDNDKFLLGVCRLFLNGEIRNEQSIRQIDNVLKFIHAGEHTDEYSEDLNEMSLADLNETFRSAAKQLNSKDRERSFNRAFNGSSDYKIIPINSYKEAEPYGRYTSWCVTHGEDAFKSYTRGGDRFYFCLKNGFESVPQNDEGAPLNEYGLSMIAVNVDSEGNLTRVTTRYNHQFNGENNPGLETTEQLENVLNVPFYQTFKPYTDDELMSMGIVPFRLVPQFLESDKSLEEIFSFVHEPNEDGIRVVELNDKQNYVTEDRQLISPEEWFDAAEAFEYGWGLIVIDDKWNYINAQGEFMFTEQWPIYLSSFYNGIAAVDISKNESNFVNTEGKLLFPEGSFSSVFEFSREGLAKVGKDGKWNWVNDKLQLVSPNLWFDKITNVSWRLAATTYLVSKDGMYNFANEKGQLIFDTWFDEVKSYSPFTPVRCGNKWNWVNEKLQLVSPNLWFDKVNEFNPKRRFTPVCLNNKFNFVTRQGELISPDLWFDTISQLWMPIKCIVYNEEGNGEVYYIDEYGNITHSKDRIYYAQNNNDKRYY